VDKKIVLTTSLGSWLHRVAVEDITHCYCCSWCYCS